MPVTHIIKAETTWSLMLKNKTSHIQWSWLAGQQSHDWLWNPRQTIQQFMKHLNVKCWKLLLLICSQKNLWKRRDSCVTVIFKINSDQIFSVLKHKVFHSLIKLHIKTRVPVHTAVHSLLHTHLHTHTLEEQKPKTTGNRFKLIYKMSFQQSFKTNCRLSCPDMDMADVFTDACLYFSFS